MLSINSKIKLINGEYMPIFGLGTWTSTDQEALNACLIAIKNGYIMIDTAAMYQNEGIVGQSLKQCGIDRKNIFIVTKLDQNSHGYQSTLQAINQQLQIMQLDYIDLYLIHTPKGGKIVETWKALIEMNQAGKLKSIGVSNFGIEQLKGLQKHYEQYMPHVNQVELHAWNHQQELLNYMLDNNIQPMGFCPLARQKLFDKTETAKIAKELNVTEAQVALRWSLQKNIITIPKSSSEMRIKENSDIFNFQLTEQHMQTIQSCNLGFKASNACNSQDIQWEIVE